MEEKEIHYYRERERGEKKGDEAMITIWERVSIDVIGYLVLVFFYESFMVGWKEGNDRCKKLRLRLLFFFKFFIVNNWWVGPKPDPGSRAYKAQFSFVLLVLTLCFSATPIWLINLLDLFSFLLFFANYLFLLQTFF